LICVRLRAAGRLNLNRILELPRPESSIINRGSLTAAAIHDDAHLLRRTREGDERAFSLLYDRYQGCIYRFALRLSGSEDLAEDVVQEVFLALIRGRQAFDPAAGPLKSYLFGMARNMVRRLVLEPPVEPDEDLQDLSEDPLDGLEQAESIAKVRRALLGLPAHYREAVVLCDLEEMSYEEAAAALECAVGTVRSRLHRARALLLARLSGLRCQA
jgi:RNA polymerase sigma-70 factor (ECF subfamily)